MDGGWFRLIALDWYDRHDGVGGIRSTRSSRCSRPPVALDAPRRSVDGRPRRAVVGRGARSPWPAHGCSRSATSAREPDDSPRGSSRSPLAASASSSATPTPSTSPALIWALVAVDHRRWWLAGVLAAVATASRPNGAIADDRHRRGRARCCVPDGGSSSRSWSRRSAFLVAWMVYLDATTGDPLLFWTAKAGWIEMTLLEFLADPLQAAVGAHPHRVVPHLPGSLRDAVPTSAPRVGRRRRARGAPATGARRRRRRPLRRARLPDPDRVRRRPLRQTALGGRRRALSCLAVCLDDLRPPRRDEVMGSVTSGAPCRSRP